MLSYIVKDPEMTKRTTKSNQIYNKLKSDYKPIYKTKNIEPYQYWGEVVKVVDGDTVDFNIALGFDIETFKRVRLFGVDAPEIHGVKKTSKEYTEGKKAAEYVESVLPPGKWVELRTFAGPREKYGRWLCEIFVDGRNFNRELINKGYALEYGKS